MESTADINAVSAEDENTTSDTAATLDTPGDALAPDSGAIGEANADKEQAPPAPDGEDTYNM